MSEPFEFEDCLLKHYVREHGWVPACKSRLAHIRSIGEPRRLRYFTFCAIGAVDVLLLDVKGIIRRSQSGHFDTITFFDRSSEAVDATTKRIPGAYGLPGDFVKIMNLPLPMSRPEDSNGPVAEEEVPATNEEETEKNLELERQSGIRDQFWGRFPFDVINLDLEEFLFKAGEDVPGNVINAFRKVFQWQRNSFRDGNRLSPVDGFTLMLTTKIGPPYMNPAHSEMLADVISNNLARDSSLSEALIDRGGFDNPEELLTNNFEIFFKISVPKLIAALLLDEDWFIDPSHGVKIFEFERVATTHTYKMLHMVMEVSRQNPDRNHRAPATTHPSVTQAYQEVVRSIFATPENIVDNDSIDENELQVSLDKVKSRRDKYYRGGI